MITEKLKSWQYYENLLPLYIKNSYGTAYHFKMLFDLLTTLDATEDELFETLDITSASFDSTNATDILDKIGLLYGIYRDVRVVYVVNGSSYTEDLHLSNEEFLKFIKAKIAQNSYDGTREDANRIYEILDLPFYMLNSSSSATVDFYIDIQESQLSSLSKLVLSGLMTLESMGIVYNYAVLDVSKLAKWDVSLWDSDNVWGI